MERKATPERSVSTAKRSAGGTALGVSSYDRAVSQLATLLMLVFGLVVILFIAWVSTNIYRAEKGLPAVMIQLGGGHENGAGKEGMQIESPEKSAEAGDGDPVDSLAAEALTALVEAAAPSTTQLDQLDDKLTRAERWVGRGPSVGSGHDSPAEGEGGGSGGGVARAQRIEIRIPEGNSVDTYARQLDAFGIELGVLASESRIIYLSKLSGEIPQQRVALRAQEKRRSLTWARGDLIEADLELCRRAGVTPTGRVVLKFIPEDTDATLLELERNFKNRPVKEIRRTRFGVRPRGETFELYVIDQTYF